MKATEVRGSAGRAGLGDAGKDKELDLLVAGAMADSLRCKLLSTVAEVAFEAGGESGAPGIYGMTVGALSKRVGEPRRRVRYHLDALCEQGLVEVMVGRQRRGVRERCFAPVRLPMLGQETVAALSPTAQKKILLACLELIFADATASLQAGAAVRHPDWAAARVLSDVDEQGRGELAALHVDLAMRAQEVMARALERMEETQECPVRVVSANLFFEAAPPQQPAP